MSTVLKSPWTAIVAVVVAVLGFLLSVHNRSIDRAEANAVNALPVRVERVETTQARHSTALSGQDGDIKVLKATQEEFKVQLRRIESTQIRTDEKTDKILELMVQERKTDFHP